MKFRTKANQGGESVHRSKSAPARQAEFISNLLTLLRAQIETSSVAPAPDAPNVRSDSMIYRGSRAADAEARAMGGGDVKCFHQTGNAVTLECDPAAGFEVTENLWDGQFLVRSSLSAS